MAEQEHETTPVSHQLTTRRSFIAAGSIAAAALGAAALLPAESHAAEETPLASDADVPASADRPSLLSSLQEPDPLPAPSVPPYEIAPDLSNIDNIDDFWLTDEEQDLLAQYGFFIRPDTDYEFFATYGDNRYWYRPSFVTVDSLTHVYHLYFSFLLRNTERNYLNDRLRSLTQSLLEICEAQLDILVGTEWEAAALITTAFMSVGALLLDGKATIRPEVADAVAAEYALILDATDTATSPIFNTPEDYTQYVVRGYYEGDETLEAYFRTMMWYGQINFSQANEELNRAALLLVLALRDGDLSDWETIYTVSAFFAGASDDCGYYEYLPLVEEAYGGGITIAGLPGNDEAWQRFRELSATVATTVSSSIPLPDADPNPQGFRLMGQRFSIDETIFQHLIYDQVGENAAGEIRLLPDVLDAAAALGSETAYDILEEQGDTAFSGYPENMAELQSALDEADESLWSASLYSQWLSMLRPLLEEKGEGWPSVMQGNAWARKDLQSFAGSFAELKHDTVLYSKQSIAEFGGDLIEVQDDRGYVEPEPILFGRLKNLVTATIEGMAYYGILRDEDAENLAIMEELAARLETMARKELRNELLTDDEYDLIRSYGDQISHFWSEVYKDEPREDGIPFMTSRAFPAAIIVDIANGGGSVLEIGTGEVSTIYVVVPIDGALRLAAGMVYSFCQFESAERLMDSQWREILGIQQKTDETYYGYNYHDLIVPWVRDFTNNL